MDLERESSMTTSTYNHGFDAFSDVAQQQQEHQRQQQFLSMPTLQHPQHQPQKQQSQPQQHQQQQPIGQQPLFGLIAAGAPVRTDFLPVDGGTKFTLSVTAGRGDFPALLTSVHELVFFLLPGASGALPPDSGVMVYWQVEVCSSGGGAVQQSGFELLGTLIPSEQQSDVFRTGWPEREEFIGLDQQLPTPIVRVNFGISIEPIDTVRNLNDNNNNNNNTAGTPNANAAAENDPMGGPTTTPSTTTVDKRPMVAQKIAKDLYNFMLSFDTGGARGNQSMTVPANIFDRWWKKFEAKLKRDPNFFLKNDNDL